MNKQDLIMHLSESVELTQAKAALALDSILRAMSGALLEGKPVRLAGFGTFFVGTRAARPGRNPATGQKIRIPERRALRFRAGKILRNSLNGPWNGQG